jgi:hypothetical protein
VLRGDDADEVSPEHAIPRRIFGGEVAATSAMTRRGKVATAPVTILSRQWLGVEKNHAFCRVLLYVPIGCQPGARDNQEVQQLLLLF